MVRKTKQGQLVVVLVAICLGCATGGARVKQVATATSTPAIEAEPGPAVVELVTLVQLYDDPKASAVYAALGPGLSVSRGPEGLQLVGRMTDWLHGAEVPGPPPLTAIRLATFGGLEPSQLEAMVELASSTWVVEERDDERQARTSRLQTALERAAFVIEDPRARPDCSAPCKPWSWQTAWSVLSTAARAKWRQGTLLRNAPMLSQSEELARRALSLIPPRSHPLTTAVSERLVGAVLHSLGDLNDDAAVLTKSLESSQRALAVFRQDLYPYDWALTQRNVQTTLGARMATSVSLAAVDDALAASSRVLDVIDQRTPKLRARMLLDRAQLLRSRWARSGDPRDLSEALRVAREAAAAVGSATEALSLAVALTRCDLESEISSRQDDAQGLRQALAHCQNLMEQPALPQASVPEAHRSYGVALLRLAFATRDEATMRRAVEQLERAIESADRLEGKRAGLKVQADYAWGLLQLGRMTKEIETTRKAQSVTAQALEQTSKPAAPLVWGQLQRLHGIALLDLGWQVRAAFRMEMAVSLYRQSRVAFAEALSVFSKDLTPKRWADLQEWMGQAYYREGEIAERQRADLFNQAIACYERALTVQRREQDPVGFAQAQVGLGSAYLMWADQKVKGPARDMAKRAESLFLTALDIYQQAGRAKATAHAKALLADALDILQLTTKTRACDALRLRVEAAHDDPGAGGLWNPVQTQLDRYDQARVDEMRCQSLPPGFVPKPASPPKKP